VFNFIFFESKVGFFFIRLINKIKNKNLNNEKNREPLPEYIRGKIYSIIVLIREKNNPLNVTKRSSEVLRKFLFTKIEMIKNAKNVANPEKFEIIKDIIKLKGKIYGNRKYENEKTNAIKLGSSP